MRWIWLVAMVTERLNLPKRYSKIISSVKEEWSWNFAEIFTTLAFTKVVFLLPLLILSLLWQLKVLMGKVKIDIYCFAISLQIFWPKKSEMFTEWSSTKHIIFFLTFQFDWMPWQLNEWSEKYTIINSSETILWVKLKLRRNVPSISLYEIFFSCCCIYTLITMDLLLEKWKLAFSVSLNDQELIKSDPTSCPQNQKGNN